MNEDKAKLILLLTEAAVTAQSVFGADSLVVEQITARLLEETAGEAVKSEQAQPEATEPQNGEEAESKKSHICGCGSAGCAVADLLLTKDANAKQFQDALINLHRSVGGDVHKVAKEVEEIIEFSHEKAIHLGVEFAAVFLENLPAFLSGNIKAIRQIRADKAKQEQEDDGVKVEVIEVSSFEELLEKLGSRK